MSGVAVVRYLLANNGQVLSVVAAKNVIAGDLPINTVLPAISISQISSVPRNTVAMSGSGVLHTDRVQAAAIVKGPLGTPSGLGYPGVKAILKMILAACPNMRGTVNGVAVDSILPDIAGPDLYDEASDIFSGSLDFIVRYTQ